MNFNRLGLRVVLTAAFFSSGCSYHPGGAHDHSAAIRDRIGATSCHNSGYSVHSKLNGSNEIIYDCQMPSGNYKCVTEEGGIANDSTAIVRLLFQNTLGSSKPTCIQ